MPGMQLNPELPMEQVPLSSLEKTNQPRAISS